jgi:predicted nucleic acid-binding protein
MYLDTSIIVKLLVEEPDTDFFQTALQGQLLSSSELAVTEIWSALLAKERKNAIGARDRAAAWRVFNERVQMKQIILHPLNSVVLKKANQVMERCHPGVPLRTLDAIHTAACDLTQDFPLCTNDHRMRDAAVMLGIPVFPETESARI